MLLPELAETMDQVERMSVSEQVLINSEVKKIIRGILENRSIEGREDNGFSNKIHWK